MNRALLILPLILLACGDADDKDTSSSSSTTSTTTSTTTTTTPTTTTTTTTGTSTTTAAPADPTGHTYVVDVGSGTWSQPAPLDSVLSQLITDNFLLSVVQITAPTLELKSAMSDGSGGQHMCIPSHNLDNPADFSADPVFSVSANTIIFLSSFGPVSLFETQISARFSTDALQLTDVSMEGLLDPSPLDILMGDSTCDLAVTFGMACLPCPSSSGVCIPVALDGGTGQDVVGLVLQDVTPADISANPSCPQ